MGPGLRFQDGKKEINKQKAGVGESLAVWGQAQDTVQRAKPDPQKLFHKHAVTSAFTRTCTIKRWKCKLQMTEEYIDLLRVSIAVMKATTRTEVGDERVH